ncbi:Lipase family protein [Perkinsela sp. CCAP 1560/4]|nr:Lipase family protein [Perkinsela sp. CCAP 1560/4]|eukprot:KNH05601.1 Lipase family protein [Perkinsela sp. CCAP 1560/4]
MYILLVCFVWYLVPQAHCSSWYTSHEPCCQTMRNTTQGFPFTYGPNSGTMHGNGGPTVGIYSRVSAFQWLCSYVCDCLFGTNYSTRVIKPFGTVYSANFPYTEMLPSSYSRELYDQCIDYSKLSFCKVRNIIDGTHYQDGSGTILDIPAKDIELYQPFQTYAYGMRGYFLLHRKTPKSANSSHLKKPTRLRLVIAFHASRNKATSRASCMIGSHRCQFCLGCDRTADGENRENQCLVYLGWYATFASLVPKIEDILKDVLDFVEEEGSLKTWAEEKDYLGSIDEIVITGSCMGGSIATLTAVYVYHWLRNDALHYLAEAMNLPVEKYELLRTALYRLSRNIFTYTFGSPRVGDRNFVLYYNSILGNNTYRVVNEGDGKVRLPLADMGFAHCGQEAYFSHSEQRDSGIPRFSKSTEISKDTLENPTMGASTLLWRAFAPPLRLHIYYSGRNVMKCEA